MLGAARTGENTQWLQKRTKTRRKSNGGELPYPAPRQFLTTGRSLTIDIAGVGICSKDTPAI